ncbi:MAG: radical SAM family heme chaperone HemW [bacterium]
MDKAPNRGSGADARGLYIHIPFCARRCRFCDFVTGPEHPGRTEAYLDALLTEARAERAALPDAPALSTLFFGGGTPSLVAPELFTRSARHLRASFPLEPGAEVSLEANPEDLDVEHLDAYRAAGITRLSIGVQSLNDRALAFLNRGHTAGVALDAIRRARRAGFDNISADLLLGIPEETEESFLAGVDQILAEGLDHLSVYALTLEERSVFGRLATRGAYEQSSDAIFERLYYATLDRADRAGLEHYEISNFAMPGRRSRHNLLYWNRASVIALGVGAVSNVGGVRLRNGGSIEHYLRFDGVVARAVDELGVEERLSEAFLLGLRLRDGIRLAEIAREFGERAFDAAWPAIDRFIGEGLLEYDRDRVRLSRRGLILSDRVLRELTFLRGDLARAAIS